MITAIVQARMNSSRLPGKVMTRFSGNSLLGHIIERIGYSTQISKIVIATTTHTADDEIVDWATNNNIDFYRGSESDVLNRYFEAAKTVQATHVARITSDDPFKDPNVIDAVAAMYLNESLDFAYNNHPPSFPEGLDTEIFSFASLAQANKTAQDPFEREHVTQFFYRNPLLFKQKNLSAPRDYSFLRWTLDTKEDLEMTKMVYDRLYKKGKIFLMNDVLDLLEREPGIQTINQNVSRSAMYNRK